MTKVISIDANLPHEISEVICLKCLSRWIAVFPEKTLLRICLQHPAESEDME